MRSWWTIHARTRDADALAAGGHRAEAIDAALESARLRCEESLRLMARGSVERLALSFTNQAGGGTELAAKLMRSESERRGGGMESDRRGAQRDSGRDRGAVGGVEACGFEGDFGRVDPVGRRLGHGWRRWR